MTQQEQCVTDQWDAQARVQRGCQWMDHADPGWEPAIDLDRLSLTSLTDCILGQRYGSYLEGITALGVDEPTAEELGFVAIVHPQMHVEYAALTAAWRTAITARRGAVVRELVPV